MMSASGLRRDPQIPSVPVSRQLWLTHDGQPAIVMTSDAAAPVTMSRRALIQSVVCINGDYLPAYMIVPTYSRNS